MDTTAIATILTTALTPVLPYLLKGGEKALEEAGKKVSGEAWDKVKTIWSKLSPKIKEEPAAREAAEKAAQAPADEQARDELRAQLKGVLDKDEAFAREMASLTINDSSLRATASGEHSNAFAGDTNRSQVISGSTLSISGDANIIGSHNYSRVTKTNAASEPATIGEFNQLLRQLREELLKADLDDKMRRSIDADLQAVEAEAQDTKPSLPIIEGKLQGVESIIERGGGTGSSSRSLTPSIRKAIEWAGRLFS
jgi:hypothetical protein